jgi:iron-sulfur cluster insertion protein
MIALTKKAVEKVKELAEGEGFDNLVLRVRVIGGGCAGFSYDLYFEDNILDMDEVEEQDGVKIVTDALSHQYIDGVTIDYVETPIGAGFKFLNPNVTSTCGCGSSFNV